MYQGEANSASIDSQGGSNISVKRTALTDAKTGMPVFQPQQITPMHQLHSSTTGQHFSFSSAAQVPPLAAFINNQMNFPIQYTPYLSLPCMFFTFSKL